MTKNNFRGNYNFPTNNNRSNEDTVLICDIIPEETEIKIALIAVSACAKNFERQDPKKKNIQRNQRKEISNRIRYFCLLDYFYYYCFYYYHSDIDSCLQR